jgi:hypothetical protein
VEGDDPEKKGYPAPPGRELGMRLTTSPQYKTLLLRSLTMDAGWAIVVKCQGKVVRTMWRRIYER